MSKVKKNVLAFKANCERCEKFMKRESLSLQQRMKICENFVGNRVNFQCFVIELH
jgi:hypothetical protein